MVLAYNHENYIIEHLESIKYLVITYGSEIDVDLIINDDYSKDKTCDLINKWIEFNSKLFREIKTKFNSKNIGTCASVNNMLSLVNAERFKLTAGDDVYSYENIFILTEHKHDFAIMTGQTLHLYGETLKVDRMTTLLSTASQIVYQDSSLFHRFKHISSCNAPNSIYASECILHPHVRKFLTCFDVVEDWPIQIAIARFFPNRQLNLIDNVLVYYRRTSGSTYLVENNRFVNDKIKIYDSLICCEKNIIEVFRLKLRRLSFKIKPKIFGRLINLDLYIFLALCILNFYKIIKKEKSIKYKLEKHQQHYDEIKEYAIIFKNTLHETNRPLKNFPHLP